MEVDVMYVTFVIIIYLLAHSSVQVTVCGASSLQHLIGLPRPHLHIFNIVISEEEEVMAACTAPGLTGRTGTIRFSFYEGSKEIPYVRVHPNRAEVTFRLHGVGIHRLHCSYTILNTRPIQSKNSNSVRVSVREMLMAPVLEIVPQNIYEGDRVEFFCTAKDVILATAVLLCQGDECLSHGTTSANHIMTALAKDSGEYRCRLEVGRGAKAVVKVVSKVVSVRELFSVPTLTMSSAEVFPMDPMTLTCRSESIELETLQREELTYSLHPPVSSLNPPVDGVFSVTALSDEFTYTCTAQARGVKKHSQPLTVRPQVPVCTPKVSVVDKAVLGRPVQILCESDRGSLPITYTLLKNHKPLYSMMVWQPGQQALFTVSVEHPREMRKYTCEAKNGGRDGRRSTSLDTAVFEPQPCQTGWIQFKEKCYYFYSFNNGWKTWSSSRQYCQRENSDLAVIETVQEQEFIGGNINPYYDKFHGFWIGLREESDKKWRWVNGRNDTLGHWIPEPFGPVGSYALMIPGRPTKSSWDKAENRMWNKFICEKEVLLKSI